MTAGCGEATGYLQNCEASTVSTACRRFCSIPHSAVLILRFCRRAGLELSCHPCHHALLAATTPCPSAISDGRQIADRMQSGCLSSCLLQALSGVVGSGRQQTTPAPQNLTCQAIRRHELQQSSKRHDVPSMLLHLLQRGCESCRLLLQLKKLQLLVVNLRRDP